MGTKTNPTRRRHRAPRRGLASFVSFLLLFAFALGQSSISALANQASTDPVASDEAAPPEDGGQDPVAEPPEEADPSPDAPSSQEPLAEEAAAEDEATGESSGGGAAPAPATRRAGTLNIARANRDAAIAAPLGAPPTPDPGPPTTTLGVQPEFVDGNPSCSDLLPAGDFLFERKIEPVADVNGLVISSGTLSGVLDVDVRNTANGQVFDFDISGDFVAKAVFVKGGSGGNLYDYRPDGANAPLMIFGDPGLGDTSLHAPINPNNDTFFGLSHISFCIGERQFEPGIDVEKSCPASVPFGQDIEYTITVTNTGNEPLVGVTVNDTLLGGDITGDFDFDFSNPFPPGEVATAHVTYTPQASDPDLLVNEVAVKGTGEESGVAASDKAACVTEITHEPGIDVTKSCPASVPFGADITFTITVENTGDEPLENVVVTDALLGGDITGAFNLPDPLPVGDTVYSAEFTYSPGAGEDPVENSVTASGDGVDSGDTVTDTDECTTDVVNPNPSIDVTKSCTPLAHVGDTVTYTITVTNDGDEDLTNVTVVDTILGDLSAAFADDLAVGASESHDFDHVVQAGDPDPLINEVTATGLGVQSETLVDDTAECVTDIIHPGIQIVKTVDEDLVPVGTTVTYTYVVTNTGDTTLYDVSVDDDVMGHIGDIPILEPGQSVTLTADFVVGEDPVTNVATASGEDVLGHSVSATDDVVVTPIAGENPSPPSAPPTPFTGSDAGRLGLIAMGLLGIGATLVAVTRRRRAEDGTL